MQIFCFIAAIIIGYENPLYSLNENSSTMICINVTNPSVQEPFTISATLLSGSPTLITASEHTMEILCQLNHLLFLYQFTEVTWSYNSKGKRMMYV